MHGEVRGLLLLLLLPSHTTLFLSFFLSLSLFDVGVRYR